MKKLNYACTKGTTWIFASLLSLLGFSSCDKFPARLEYGTPHANYTVSGKVTDTQGKALSQIRVVIPTIVHETPGRPGFIPDRPTTTIEIKDTLFTKSDGTFVYTYDGFPTDTVRIHLKFEEPSINPSFEADSTRVNFTLSDLKGGKRWYYGSAKKEVNMKLKQR
jgi:putative lipoprotein (rSAM/lipoprotein system)